MENSNQSTQLDYWRSFKSLLCAVPIANRDNNHKNVMDMRLKLSSAKDANLETPRIFPKIIERHGRQETIGWIDTSYGAYAIVEKTLPIPHKGIYHSHRGVSVFFSEHPESLESVLSGNTTNFADIDVLSFHRKGDHFANGEMSYDKMAERIQDDHARLRKDIQTHETFIQESNRLIRSESCVVFAIKDKNNPDHYTIYQYVNHLGDDGFFVRDDMLDSSVYKNTLMALSVKVTLKSIPKSELNKMMRETANVAAADLMNHFNPNRNYKGILNKVKSGLQSGTQPLAHLVARIHYPAFIAGMGIAAIFSSGLVLAGTLVASLKVAGVASLFTRAGLTGLLLSNNVFGKAFNGISKFITKTLNRTKLNHYTRLYDYKSDFTTDTKFIFDTLRSCKMPESFFKDMRLIPYENVKDAFGVVKDLPLHTDKDEKQWQLIQRCYADCHRGASLISQVRNTQTGDLALQLIDGEGVKHIHDRQGHVFSFDYDQPTSIIRDNDRGEYLRYELHDIPKFVRAEYVAPPLNNDADKPLSSDEVLDDMLALKVAARAKMKTAKMRGQFEVSAVGEERTKNHHLSESVARNEPVRKL